MNNELSDATLSSKSILDAIDKEPIQIQFNKDKKLSDVIAISQFDWISWPIAASFIAVLFVGAMITMNHPHMKASNAIEIAEDVPNEYIEAHQMLAPTNVAFYVDTESK
jgi:sigma-E factor negative regulatory protein RseA